LKIDSKYPTLALTIQEIVSCWQLHAIEDALAEALAAV
jgi:hypothetical protein